MDEPLAKDMLEDEPTASSEVDLVMREIERANKRFEGWVETGERVVSLFRGDGDGVNDDSNRFNILWSNTETQRPFLYSQTPEPMVRRRFLEPDEPARVAAQLMERNIAYCMEIENHEFDDAMKSAVEDFLLSGRGQVRVVYNAEFDEVEEPVGREADGSLMMESREVKAYEEAYIEYVYWKDFLHSEGRCWNEVWWVAFASNPTRADLRDQFGKEIADKVPLINEIEDDDDKATDYRKNYERKDCARVWEFWNKRTMKVYKVAEGYDEFLEEPIDDPLGLGGVFPCPQPLYMMKTTGSLEPVPEYRLYESLAAEVNTQTARIENLTCALRVAGVYDSSIAAPLSKLISGRENELIPVENFTALQQAGGMRGAIDWLPIDQIVNALQQLIPLREKNLEIIYQLTGIVDIIRGVAVARETKAAAEARASYATGRLGEKQRKVERFAQRALSLLGEVIAEHFDEKTMFMITGVQPNENTIQGMQMAVQILRDDLMRGFKIDVETDSTIADDAEREKKELGEFLGGISGFIQAASGGVQAGILPKEMALELILFAARRFRTGRQLEDKLQAIGQQEPPQQEDPQQQEQQAKMQLEKAKLDLEKAKIEGDQALKAQELMLKQAEMMQKGEIEGAKLQQKHMEALINRDTARINASGGNE